MKKKLFIGLGIAYAIFSLIMAIALFGGDDTTTTKKEQAQEKKTKNEASWLIVQHEHGDKYPYNEDYLSMYCQGSAVWFETNEGNLYSLNDVAHHLLKNDKNYKGDTSLILKEGMHDLYTPKEALNFCYKKTFANYHLLKSEYGDKYPYRIDDLTVYCQGSAVWFEDNNGNKYALNDVAKNLLKNNKKYKGDTSLILKEGMHDLYTSEEIFEFNPRGIHIKYDEV